MVDGCRPVKGCIKKWIHGFVNGQPELDWLLYNKPLEYAQMVLGGEIEHYLSLGCDHGYLED